MGDGTTPDLEKFVTAARRWLDSHATRPLSASGPTGRSVSDSFRIFADPSPEEAQAEVDATRAWQRQKWDAGYAGISWPASLGGRGLTRAHERAFHRLEREYDVPRGTEAFNVTLGMVAPTIQSLGTQEQQQRFIPAFLRADLLCCQLFSEPDAGSDLASVTTSATRQGAAGASTDRRSGARARRFASGAKPW